MVYPGNILIIIFEFSSGLIIDSPVNQGPLIIHPENKLCPLFRTDLDFRTELVAGKECHQFEAEGFCGRRIHFSR